MKFAAGLLVAAVAVASVNAFCPDACPDVYDPVTDENGVTYPNECSMQAAKCKGEKKDEDPLEEYKRIYGRSFGASRDVDDDSNTPKSYCPNVLCPAVYQPVTDENGKTYPNKCSMEVAKCKGPRENVLDEYKRLYGHSFGASRDTGDDEGSNKPEQSEKSEKKSHANGSMIGQLYDDNSDEGVIGCDKPKSSKKCADACPAIMNPVCGSDGITYSNPCELKIAACKYPERNIVEDESACSKTTTQDETILQD